MKSALEECQRISKGSKTVGKNLKEFLKAKKDILKRSMKMTFLSSFYRLAKEKDSELKSPCLLLIRDTDNHCFGAYLSESPKLSDKCYGCGETFVFTLNPTQKTYKWSAKCEKNFFIWGSTDSISVGVDDGKFALYLDSALNQGRSQAVSTFENEPLTTENGDFIALQVEVWTFR